MRKHVAKFFAVALLFVVMLSFTACSLFTDDLDYRYSADIMVASAANTNISVSRKELYDVYREWGYQYANQMAETELLEYLTEYVLNNKILRQISQEKYGALRDSELALARKNAYATLDSVWRQYVYEILGQDDPASAEDTATDDAVTYTPYTKSILVERNVVTTVPPEQEGTDPVMVKRDVYTLNLDAYRDDAEVLRANDYSVYTPNVAGVANDKVAKQALAKIVRNLQNLENGFTKLTKPTTNYLDLTNKYLAALSSAERDTLNRELARIIENNCLSIMASRISTAYNLGLINLTGENAVQAWDAYLQRGNDFDAWARKINYGITADDPDYNAATDAWALDNAVGQSVATKRANDATAYYLDQVRDAMNQYTYQGDDDLESTILNGKLESLYYAPHDVAENLFTVSHILIGFTDEQKASYTKITTEGTKNPSYLTQNKLNELYAATTSNGKTAYQIYAEVKSTLMNINNLNDRYTTFRDFIYQYNTDPGMQNPTCEYVMSVNSDKNIMVPEFTAASIALKENTDGRGGKGAISGLVWTEHGAHIIMYTRDLAELVWTGDATMLDSYYADTLFATMTAYGNQTRFDTMAEKFTRSYSNYQAHLLADFKSEHTITITQSEFKNFLG